MIVTRPIVSAGLVAVLIFTAIILSRSPSHDRDWQPHLGVTPSVERSEAGVRIAPVRDWSYDASGPIDEIWIEQGAAFDPTDVAQVWFVLEPHPGIPMMAHTLVLFELEDGSLHGLTIEARKQRHEKFAPVAGALRRFELIYVWATPKDLLTRRAVYLDHEIYIYPLELSRADRRAYLRALATRTEAIHARPRFYNTLHSNCTNELAKTADLGWQPAFVLTGRAAEALFDKGLIAGEDFEVARARADMTATIIRLNELDAEAFNAALLEELLD